MVSPHVLVPQIQTFVSSASENVYAAVQNAVFAWNPAGARLFSLTVPQDPTNVELGGRNGKTLYITAGKSLYRVQLTIAGK